MRSKVFNGPGSAIKGTGIVRWIRKEKENDLEPGCGIEFDEIDEKSYAKLVKVINNVKTGRFIPRG